MMRAIPPKGALPKVAILGRPNVGKSTFFNRLVGKKMAIVHDRPGVTRDWKIHKGKLADLWFDIIDTAGLDGFESDVIKGQIETQTDRLIVDADILCLMIDGQEQLTASDKWLAEKIRLSSKPVLVIVNKCEGRAGQSTMLEAFQLGIGEPIPFSAAHGEGLDCLYDGLRPLVDEWNHRNGTLTSADDGDDAPKEKQDLTMLPSRIRVAVVGRPNAGKSTLINRLVGDDRLLTGDEPGITRDSITLDWTYEGQQFQLVDTAGLRRRARIQDAVERCAAEETLQAVRFCDVAVLLLDPSEPLSKQDLTIASHVVNEGRCLVLALNKWDQADHSILKEIQYQLTTHLPQVKGIPLVPISALKGRNLDKLMAEVSKIFALWNKRLSTASLNKWLMEATDRHPPPLSGIGRIRLKYATQVKSRPPTFAFFVSKPVDLPTSYERYLMNSLRDYFDMPGVPMRLLMRKGKNPYDPK